MKKPHSLWSHLHGNSKRNETSIDIGISGSLGDFLLWVTGPVASSMATFIGSGVLAAILPASVESLPVSSRQARAY